MEEPKLRDLLFISVQGGGDDGIGRECENLSRCVTGRSDGSSGSGSTKAE
jgi:hypothetical protein